DAVLNTIVAPPSGCQGGQSKLGVDGSPVRANAIHALLICSAIFCGSGPVPTIEVDLATLSNTNARSREWGLCHVPPSTGVGQSGSERYPGVAFCGAFSPACVHAPLRKVLAVAMAKKSSGGVASG